LHLIGVPDLMASIREFFDHSPAGIVCAYVYGSVARGIRFEVKAHNAYFDPLPYLRQYRRTVRKLSS
jgi:hypothetical protein